MGACRSCATHGPSEKVLAAGILAAKRLLPVMRRALAGCFHKNEVKILEVVKLMYLI